MIKNIEQLKIERPDLVESFEKMSKEQLLEQCYNECIDAINMEERVALFMEECTINMSKTNYTLESIKTLIDNKKEFDINEFCYYETRYVESDEELANSIRERAKLYEV